VVGAVFRIAIEGNGKPSKPPASPNS